MIQQLKEQVADLQEQINQNRLDKFIYPNAGAHNSIYRGKYLGDHVTNEQIEAIDAGTFEDLYIGDYWTINDVNWIIGGMNFWSGALRDYPEMGNHLAVFPRNNLYNAQMNTSKTTSGGYIKSNMYTNGLSEAIVLIKKSFSNYLIKHPVTLTNAVTNGYGSACTWDNIEVDLMDEATVYGMSNYRAMGYGSSSYTPAQWSYSLTQLPVFGLNPELITSKKIDGVSSCYWLKDIATTYAFADVDGAGFCCYHDANTNYGVRPIFAIGKPDEVESEEKN